MEPLELSYEFALVNLYAVVVNEDGTEGRGHDIIYCYCTNRNDAETIAIGKDVMGSDGKVREVGALTNKDGEYFSINNRIGTTKPNPISIRVPSKAELKKHEEKNIHLRAAQIKNKISNDDLEFLRQHKHLL